MARPALDWTLICIAVAVRVLLIIWGEIQDHLLQVKYTDIDYVVFTDAARFVAQGQSPFLRSTYRYSPLLAYLMLPNVLLHPACGKVLFSAGDILAALMIRSMLRATSASPMQLSCALALWLFNPFTFTISTRGSCDVLAVLLLLGLLLLLLRGSTVWAALLYGLAVHFRVYPIIYAPAIVLFLARRACHSHLLQSSTSGTKDQAPGQAASSSSSSSSSTSRVVAGTQGESTARRLLSLVVQCVRCGAVFGTLSAAVFLGLGCLFLKLYGHTFVHEAFLYHLGRRDPRHSFSVYFYPTYLSMGSTLSSTAVNTTVVAQQAGPLASLLLQPPDVDRLALVPQLGLQLVLAVSLHLDLPLCMLMQTMTFVAFNKVITAQYFVWYFSLVPLVVPQLPWPLPRGLLLAAAAWLLGQLHWLGWAYLLEFKGMPVQLPLWAASVLFFAANVALMVQLLVVVRCSPAVAGSDISSRSGGSGSMGRNKRQVPQEMCPPHVALTWPRYFCVACACMEGRSRQVLAKSHVD